MKDLKQIMKFIKKVKSWDNFNLNLYMEFLRVRNPEVYAEILLETGKTC